MTSINNECPYISKNKITFSFDGKTFPAYEGDTIASALLRNNIRLVGRSFKYHRPRGIYTCGIEEPNALVQIISEHNEPNTRATIKRVYDGMEIISQNRWPSLRHDFGAINNILSPIFSAGFYYKTFMGPKGFWKNLYEPLIRRSAGLGKPPKNFRSKSTHQYHNTDVVIIGAGLSGLAAAKKFINTKYKVLLIEQDCYLGGILKNSNKVYTIGFAAANLQADFFNFIKESVEAETARLGHKSIVVDSGGDDAKQVSQIEDLITKQIDALVLIISGNTDGNAQIRKAKEAGIPVITVDRNTTNPPGDSFVASDSEVASYEMGMWVAEQTGGKGVVGVIQGQLGSTPEIARDTGFEDAIAQFPDLNTVEKQASKMWSRDEGVSIAQDLLTRNPNITVLYGRCDALAQGAAQAAKAMGRDDLLIVGFDGDRAALEDLKKGNTLLAATMTQQTLTIGRTATRFAIDAIEGRYIPPEVLYGSTLTTQDNVEQFMGDGHP